MISISWLFYCFLIVAQSASCCEISDRQIKECQATGRCEFCKRSHIEPLHTDRRENLSTLSNELQKPVPNVSRKDEGVKINIKKSWTTSTHAVNQQDVSDSNLLNEQLHGFTSETQSADFDQNLVVSTTTSDGLVWMPSKKEYESFKKILDSEPDVDNLTSWVQLLTSSFAGLILVVIAFSIILYRKIRNERRNSSDPVRDKESTHRNFWSNSANKIVSVVKSTFLKPKTTSDVEAAEIDNCSDDIFESNGFRQSSLKNCKEQGDGASTLVDKGCISSSINRDPVIKENSHPFINLVNSQDYKEHPGSEIVEHKEEVNENVDEFVTSINVRPSFRESPQNKSSIYATSNDLKAEVYKAPPSSEDIGVHENDKSQETKLEMAPIVMKHNEDEVLKILKQEIMALPEFQSSCVRNENQWKKGDGNKSHIQHCPFCGKQYTYKKNYRKHLCTIHHVDENLKPIN